MEVQHTKEILIDTKNAEILGQGQLTKFLRYVRYLSRYVLSDANN